MQVGGNRVFVARDLFERRDVVHDPDGPAVGSQNQVAVARMNLEVEHRNRGQAVRQFLPVLPVVEGSVQPELRAREEEV